MKSLYKTVYLTSPRRYAIHDFVEFLAEVVEPFTLESCTYEVDRNTFILINNAAGEKLVHNGMSIIGGLVEVMR